MKTKVRGATGFKEQYTYQKTIVRVLSLFFGFFFKSIASHIFTSILPNKLFIKNKIFLGSGS